MRKIVRGKGSIQSEHVKCASDGRRGRGRGRRGYWLDRWADREKIIGINRNRHASGFEYFLLLSFLLSSSSSRFFTTYLLGTS